MDFVCKDPDGMVRAANVRATLEAFKLVPAAGLRIIERHDVRTDHLRPGAFIHVQKWLNALKDIESDVGPAKLRHVGRNIVQSAEIPVASCESLLLGLDAVYQMNRRGNVGHYRTTQYADGTIEVRCETPYPRNFEWGLIEGFCQNKAIGEERYAVEYIDGPKHGDLTCTLLVRRRP